MYIIMVFKLFPLTSNKCMYNLLLYKPKRTAYPKEFAL